MARNVLLPEAVGAEAGLQPYNRYDVLSSSNPDAKAIFEGIKDNRIPPDMPGVDRRVKSAVYSLAASDGYDLVGALAESKGLQRYWSSLNSPQQVRLRQAIDFVPPLSQTVRGLINQWNVSNFEPLNKAVMEGALKGLAGREAQALARKIHGSVGDLVAEVAQVYRGGNASTNETLKLAAENLNKYEGSYSILQSLDQIEHITKLRQNSLKLPSIGGPANRYNKTIQNGSNSSPAVIQEGSTATDAKGNKIILKGGKWQPLSQ